MARTPLAGRVLFVYAGNMGVAQGMPVLMDLAEAMLHDERAGFVFVGRGHGYAALVLDAARRGLSNVWFHDEIDPDEVPGLLAQCHVGLVALDRRHQSHNIPGKFLSYMHAGMPVLASVNPGNDLVSLIEERGVGEAVCSHDIADLVPAAQRLVALIQSKDAPELASRSRALAEVLFSSQVAAEQVVAGLRS
jgi:glycosyltransferase involved in cell wall biosynthesis